MIVVTFLIIACSKNDDGNSNNKEGNYDYYTDNSGIYVLELGEDGYSIFENGKPAESASNAKKTAVRAAGFTKTVNKYTGVCILPPDWRQTKVEYPGGLTRRQSFAKSLSTVNGGYRITPRPVFLGGSSMPCYECLLANGEITREEFYLAICNGRLAFGGNVLDASTISTYNQMLSGVNFTGPEVTEFITRIEATGAYKCTNR